MVQIISEAEADPEFTVAGSEGCGGDAGGEAQAAETELKAEVGGDATWAAVGDAGPVAGGIFPKKGSVAVAGSGVDAEPVAGAEDKASCDGKARDAGTA